jgi:uncharacterized BrkB/YihY/UPF0761 family membrane protein
VDDNLETDDRPLEIRWQREPMTIIEIGKRSITAFGEDKAQRLASSVAFSAIFSIAPLFIVLIAILGAFLGSHGTAQDKVARRRALERGQLRR